MLMYSRISSTYFILSNVKLAVWNGIVFLVHTASSDSADVMQGYLITHKISVIYLIK